MTGRRKLRRASGAEGRGTGCLCDLQRQVAFHVVTDVAING